MVGDPVRGQIRGRIRHWSWGWAWKGESIEPFPIQGGPGWLDAHLVDHCLTPALAGWMHASMIGSIRSRRRRRGPPILLAAFGS